MYRDAVVMYSTKPKLVNQFPLSVHFDGEEGLDFGGVCRDFFSGFWEEAYVKMFDGAALLTPVSRADIDLNQFAVLGKILSHGYLCSGFLPTRISFPVLALVLLGPSTTISRETLVSCFLEFVSQVDRKTIAEALEAKEFSGAMRDGLVNILSRFGCRDMPTPQNLKNQLFSLAQHQFRSQPFAAISMMNSGIPEKHRPFWQSMSDDEFRLLCDSLMANPEKILEKLEEPVFRHSNEGRVFSYLQQYIGEMKLEEAKRFLRFVTGSSVLSSDGISVCFNALEGAGRRPISHTCSNKLELPYTYGTFLEFAEEFTALLRCGELCWSMNTL